jgi:N,N'-diacetyllegionaminate synthase
MVYYKTKIISECGLSHEGSIIKAKKFIELSKLNGADIVKFQTHIAEFESTLDEKFRKKMSKKYKNRYDYWKKTSFNQKQWKEIINFSKKKKIKFLSSVFSEEAVDMLHKLGQTTFKIGSGEFFSKKVIDKIINLKCNIIISTGMATMKEIDSLIKYLKFRKSKFTIMQCTSSYPCDLKNTNLHLIDLFKKKYNCPVGYSDHTGSVYSSILALSKKISHLECHVVDVKNPNNPDSSSSIYFNELKFLSKTNDSFYRCNYRNSAEDKDRVSNIFKKNRTLFSKSLCLKTSKPKGYVVLESDLTLKKPGYGLKIEDQKKIIGKKLKINKSNLRLLRFSDFDK